MKNITIIGAGIGGLTTAIRLLNRGYNVTIYEKESSIGGKVNYIEKQGYKFDLTASILMTSNIYTEIFESVGKDYRNYFEMVKLDDLYKVTYYDKTVYTFKSDLSYNVKLLDNIEKDLSVSYTNLITTSLNKYLICKEGFLDKPMTNVKEIVNYTTIKNLINIRPLSTVESYIKSKVSNEKLQEYLIFQSMYIGINPYKSSNIYTLIPAITQAYGIAYIRGGIYNYILSLEKLIDELGGKIITNTKVDEIIIENKKALGIRIHNKTINSDYVICNADYPYAIRSLFKDNIKENINLKIRNKELSYSVFIIYLGLRKKINELSVHNIYINKDFKTGIEDSYNGSLSLNPSLYLYYPSAIDESLAPIGKSVLNIMVRVPNLESDIIWDKKTINNYRNLIIKTVKNIKGLENIEDLIEYESYLTPRDLEVKCNAYKGNAFGLSHKLTQSTILRPHINSKKISNLYFIGSSTHPGNGVSVIIEGSKLVCNEIK